MFTLAAGGAQATIQSGELLETWSGDFDGMVERGFLRILTVHNPLLFNVRRERANRPRRRT